MTGRLSIFAGSGALVPHAARAATAAGYKVQILALAPREAIPGVKLVSADLGNPLGIIWALKVFRTTHIVMAGGVSLPDKTREDLIRFANNNAPANDDAGDTGVGDIALARIGGLLKKMTGADLVGVHELAPDLLAPAGHIAGPEPDPGYSQHLQFALATARAIGRLDIGQAAITCGARVIAVEDIGGTDTLIARTGQFRIEGLTGDGAAPLVLAKALKPQQPLFADLPAIGPETVANCARAGIGTIVVEAGRSLIIERERLAELAVAENISVVGAALADA